MAFSKGVAQKIGLMTVSSSDHFTYTAADDFSVEISKDGGSFASPVGTIQSLGGGSYVFSATAEDMNCDLLAIKGSGTGVDDVRCFFYTEDHYTVGRAGNLDNLDAAVSGVEAKVDNLDSDLGTVGGKVDNLDSDLVTVGAAVTSIEGKVDTVSTNVGALSTSVSGVGSKVDNLDSDLVAVAAVVDGVDGKVDEIVGTLSGISGGTGANTVTITVSDGENVVRGLGVTIHNASQSDAGIVQVTDQNGRVVFGLDNGSYKVVVQSETGYAPNNPYSLTVDGVTSLTVTVDPISLPSSSDPSLCRCYCYMRHAVGGAALGQGEGSLSLVSIDSRPSLDHSIYTTGNAAATDTSGLAYLDLPRGMLCTVQGFWPEGASNLVQLTVPNSANYDLGLVLQR